MSERSEIERAIHLFFDAMNANDASIIPLADDVVMSGPMMPEPISGADAVRQYINETAPFISRMDQKTTVIEGENAAVIVEFEGLNGVCIEGVEFFRVKNGLIGSDQVFFDTRPLFKGAN
jgi:hypothetical protein